MLSVCIITFHIAGAEDLLCHVGQSEPWFNFIANCWLFEACTYHTVTLEMVHLIPVILSTEPAVLQLPPALCEIGLFNKGNMN